MFGGTNNYEQAQLRATWVLPMREKQFLSEMGAELFPLSLEASNNAAN